MKVFYNFIISCTILCINCEKLPQDIQLCRSEDTECIVKVTNDLIKKYHSGRSDLNIPSIDPFYIKNLDLNLPQGNLIDLNLNLKDIYVIGMSSMVVDKAVGFTKDPLTSKFEMSSMIPKFEFYGNYSANGRLLFLPLQGDGNFKITLKNSKFEFRFKPKAYKKIDGLTYLKLEKIKINVEPESIQMNIRNLFGGNEELNKAMNILINENWKELWEEFSPTAYKVAEKMIKEIASGIFERFNYDDIYLD